MAELGPVTGATAFTRQTDDTLVVGNPIHVKVGGTLGLARADGLPQADPIGIAATDTAPGFSARIITKGKVYRADWTPVVGVAALTPGAKYFLDPSTAGLITKIAPSGAGQFVVLVGRALTALDLDVDIEPSVLKV